jgi:hypothetical protein
LGGKGIDVAFRLKSQNEIDNKEEQDVGGWTILRWILERKDWILPAQDRDQWRALAYTVMNVRFP